MSELITSRIQIEVRNLITVRELFRTAELRPGQTATSTEGLRVELVAAEEGLAFSDSTLVEFMLTFGTGVASRVVASALLKMLGNVRRLSVDGRQVRPTEEELAKALETIRRFSDTSEKSSPNPESPKQP